MVYTGSMGAGPLHTQVCSIKNSTCTAQHVQVVWIQQVHDSHPTTSTAVTDWAHFLQKKTWPLITGICKAVHNRNSLVACNKGGKKLPPARCGHMRSKQKQFYQASLQFPK